MSSTNRLSVWPLGVAFAIIGFFTWLFDLYYERLWAAAGWEILDNNSAMIFSGGIGIATAFTIAYITNRRVHRLDELLQKLENVKIEGNDASIQLSKIPFDWGKYLGYLSVPAVIAFASGFGISYSDQPVTMISIFLASISIGLAIAIFGIQQSQGAQIKNISEKINSATNEIHEMTSEQMKLLNDTKEAYAESIVNYIQRISINYFGPLDRYEEYNYADATLDLKEKTRHSIKQTYDNMFHHGLPKIDQIELVKTFGLEITNQYWINTAKLFAEDWQPHNDYGLALLIHSYKQEMFNLIELKNIFLPYCHVSTQTRDEKFEKYYEKITKEWLDEKSPNKSDFE